MRAGPTRTGSGFIFLFLQQQNFCGRGQRTNHRCPSLWPPQRLTLRPQSTTQYKLYIFSFFLSMFSDPQLTHTCVISASSYQDQLLSGCSWNSFNRVPSSQPQSKHFSTVINLLQIIVQSYVVSEATFTVITPPISLNHVSL